MIENASQITLQDIVAISLGANGSMQPYGRPAYTGASLMTRKAESFHCRAYLARDLDDTEATLK